MDLSGSWDKISGHVFPAHANTASIKWLLVIIKFISHPGRQSDLQTSRNLAQATVDISDCIECWLNTSHFREDSSKLNSAQETGCERTVS